MKIAYVVNTFPPYWSGTGVVAINLAQSLSALGHDIHVFIPETKDNKDIQYSNFTIHKQHALIKIGQAPLTPGLLNIKRFDLIHLHFPYYFGGEISTLVSKFRNIPLVVTYHNDVIKPGISGYIVKFHTQLIAPWILRNADCIFAMSQKFATESRLLSQFIGDRKIEIIPQGVDTKRFCIPADQGEIPGLSKSKPIVLFVRTLDQAHFHCGLEYLIKAMVEVMPECQLLVIGDGELRGYYENLSVEYGVSERVHFIGAIPNEKLPPFYSAASLFVLPSAETENAGVVLLEAMACGIPVVATDVGGSKELVKDGINGLLVPPRNHSAIANAINFLISDKEVATEIGRRAREEVETNSSWEAVAKRVERIYERLV